MSRNQITGMAVRNDLSNEDIMKHVRRGETNASIARFFNVHPTTVRKVKIGQRRCPTTLTRAVGKQQEPKICGCCKSRPVDPSLTRLCMRCYKTASSSADEWTPSLPAGTLL